MFLPGNEPHIKSDNNNNNTACGNDSAAVGMSIAGSTAPTPTSTGSGGGHPHGLSSSPNIGQLLNPIHPLNSTIKQDDPSVTNAQLFQSMDIDNAPKYQSFPLQATTASSNGTAHFDGYNNSNHYYGQRQNGEEQQGAHSANNLVPMFRNGMVLPNTNSSSMYDESASDLGIEPLMLK